MTNKNKSKKNNNAKNKVVLYKTPKIPANHSVNTATAGRPNKAISKKGGGKRTNVPQFTLANADPFHDNAFGVKIPDECSMLSCAAFSRDEYIINSVSVTGSFTQATVFTVDPGAATAQSLTPVSGVWTWPATFANANAVGNRAALISSFSEIRCAAGGIRISVPTSYTNTQGFMHVALIADLRDQSTWSYPTSLTAMQNADAYMRIPMTDLIENELRVSHKWTDYTAFRYFNPGIPTATYTGNLPSTGWAAIMVYCDGLSATPSIAAYNVETIKHWEGIAPGNAAAGITPRSQPAPYSPAVLAGTKYVQDCLPAIQVVADDINSENTFLSTIGSLFNQGVNIANGVIDGAYKIAGIASRVIPLASLFI
jgi:hypothetical protein